MGKEQKIKINSWIAGEYIATKYDEVLDYNGNLIGYAGSIDNDNLLLEALKKAKKNQVNLKKIIDLRTDEIISEIHSTVTWFNKNRRKLSKLLTLESGYPIKHSEELVSASENYIFQIPHFFSFYKETLNSEKINMNYSFIDPYSRQISYIRQPYGVILCITPSNAPIPLIPTMIISAIITGNSIIIKPSSKVLLSSLKIIEPLASIDVVKEAINVIHAPTKKILDLGFSNDVFDLIHYTGSSRHISSLMNDATVNGVEVIAEGEGNGVVIVDNNVNVESVANTLAQSIIRCNGELCTSPNGILVHKDIYNSLRESLIEKFGNLKIGDPLDRNTDVGPLFSIETAQTLEKQVNKALKEGANLLIGGKREESIFYPTLIENVKSRMEIVKEESFGPLIWMKNFSTYEEIIEIFSYNKYGLNLTIFSDTPSKVMSFFSKAFVNRICTNCDPTIQSPFSPWGAMRKTGISQSDFLPNKYMRKVIMVEEDMKKTDKRFKALVLEKPKKIELKEMPLVEDKRHIIVKMLWSGICGTDKQAYLGKIEVPYPVVLGHENIGKIIYLPTDDLRNVNGNKLEVGDIITWPAIVPCGKCIFCKSGKENLCISQRVFGMSYTASISPHIFGGWAEYAYLSDKIPIVKLDKDASREPTIILAEPLATAVVLEKYQTEIENGDIQNILIFGSGTLGALFAFYAKYIGIKEIIAVGSSKRIPIIENFVTNYISRDNVNVEIELYSLKKEGYDLIIDATGLPSTFSTALQLVRPEGTILEVGSIGETHVTMDISKIVKSDINVQGHIAYTIKDFVKAINIVKENKTLLAPLVSGIYSINEYKEAFDKSFSHEAFKVVFDLSR